MRNKPKAVKPVKSWALQDKWGDYYGYSAPYLFQTRGTAKSTSGQLVDNGWRVRRVQITLAKQPRRSVRSSR